MWCYSLAILSHFAQYTPQFFSVLPWTSSENKFVQISGSYSGKTKSVQLKSIKVLSIMSISMPGLIEKAWMVSSRSWQNPAALIILKILQLSLQKKSGRLVSGLHGYRLRHIKCTVRSMHWSETPPICRIFMAALMSKLSKLSAAPIIGSSKVDGYPYMVLRPAKSRHVDIDSGSNWHLYENKSRNLFLEWSCCLYCC